MGVLKQAFCSLSDFNIDSDECVLNKRKEFFFKWGDSKVEGL